MSVRLEELKVGDIVEYLGDDSLHYALKAGVLGKVLIRDFGDSTVKVEWDSTKEYKYSSTLWAPCDSVSLYTPKPDPEHLELKTYVDGDWGEPTELSDDIKELLDQL